MAEGSSNWIEFWDTQEVMDDKSWRKNAELLVEGSQAFFPLRSDDTVLDLGSGPGLLADIIADDVNAIHCVDTSKRYIEQARQRLKNQKNVECFLLGDAYLNFNFLPESTYSRVFCASVIQYYKNLDEIETLIIEMRKRIKPGGKMLIADISVTTSHISDLVGLITTAWRKKYLLDIVKFILKSLGGDYSRLRKEKGLLSVKKSDLDTIVSRQGLRAEWRNDVLTLNKTRWHLLVHF